MATINQTNASAILLEANNDACLLLDKLDKDPKVGQEIDQFLVNSSRALIFTWTVKAGVIFGVQGGGGFMITRLDGGKWSAPCFVTVAAAQAGPILGVEKVETIMAARDHTIVREVCEGMTPVLGSDLSLQAWPLTSGTQSGLDALRAKWNQFDLVSISSSQGVMFDFSFKGGAITPHTARNAEVYGADKSTKDILMGHVPAPEELVPLYEKLDRLSAGQDPGLSAPSM